MTAPVRADQEEALLEDEAEFRQPAPPPIPVRKRYYITECEHCGWVGSSEQCGSDDDDIICPVCCSSMAGDAPSGADTAKHGEAVMQRILAAESERDSHVASLAAATIQISHLAQAKGKAEAKVDQLAADLREAREELDRLREAHRASRYLSGLYRRCWLGRPVRDLGGAEAAYDTARAALTPDPHQAAGSASGKEETDASGS